MQACIATSSGMSAITMLVMSLLEAGDHVICSQSVFGATLVLFVVEGEGAELARKNAFHVIDGTRVCSITAKLGDTKTTITHPSSTSHGRLTEAQRQAAGITQGMVRLAVGLDDVLDLKADLLRGLGTLRR